MTRKTKDNIITLYTDDDLETWKTGIGKKVQFIAPIEEKFLHNQINKYLFREVLIGVLEFNINKEHKRITIHKNFSITLKENIPCTYLSVFWNKWETERVWLLEKFIRTGGVEAFRIDSLNYHETIFDVKHEMLNLGFTNEDFIKSLIK